jgi:hypothetical protein
LFLSFSTLSFYYHRKAAPFDLRLADGTRPP